jgi:tetratricopeptide (TPR) repeat protein
LGKVLFVSQAASTALEAVLEDYFSLAPEERDQTSMVAPDRLEQITSSTRMYGRLDLLGKMALSQGEVVKAQALFEECLAFYRAQGYRSDTAEALAALGQVAAVQQDYATALAMKRACCSSALGSLSNKGTGWCSGVKRPLPFTCSSASLWATWNSSASYDRVAVTHNG